MYVAYWRLMPRGTPVYAFMYSCFCFTSQKRFDLNLITLFRSWEKLFKVFVSMFYVFYVSISNLLKNSFVERVIKYFYPFTIKISISKDIILSCLFTLVIFRSIWNTLALKNNKPVLDWGVINVLKTFSIIVFILISLFLRTCFINLISILGSTLRWKSCFYVNF